MRWLLALACACALAIPAPARADGLTRASGEAIAEIVRSGSWSPLVPKGWELTNAQTDREGLVLSFATAGRTPEIRLGERRGDATDGHWFSFRPLGDPTPEERSALLTVARHIDAGLTSDPWVKSTWNPVGPIQARAPRLPTALVLFLVGLALLLATDPGRRARAALARTASRRPYIVVALITLAAAGLYLHRLDLTLDRDELTQRVFFSTLDVPDILLHRYEDERHPPLFYLVLHFFPGSVEHAWVARLPAALFALTTLIASYLFARRIMDAPRALLVPALLVLSAPFMAHARDVSDVTLFLTLMLLSSTVLLDALERPRRAAFVGLALVEAALLYSYYVAVLVLAVHVLVLIVCARDRRYRGAWLAVGAAVLAAAPVLTRFVLLIVHDHALRTVTARFSHHLWGDQSSGSFAVETWALLAAPGGRVAVAILLGLGLLRFARRALRRQAVAVLVLGLSAAALATIALGATSVRLKPYYLLYLLPLSCVLIVVGASCTGEDAPPRLQRALTALGAFGLLFVLATRANDLREQAPRQYAGAGAALEALIGRVRADGPPQRMAADPHYLHTLLLYHLFPDAAALYRTCSIAGEEGLRCGDHDRRIVMLTSTQLLSDGWEERSLKRFDALLEDGPWWFVYLEQFENHPLLQRLEARCTDEGQWRPYRLFRCGRR